MSPRPPRPRPRALLNAALVLTASAAAVLAASAVQGQAQKTAPAPGAADPEVNKQFVTPNVKALVERLETEGREVYAHRQAIVDALGLKRGMAVADVGAGTGAFTRLLADRVGPEGVVYAVDIARPLIQHIEERARKEGQRQVKTLLASQESTGLAANSIDLAFLCDVYHHLERPRQSLASIRQALRPNGQLVVVDFDRSKAKDGTFVKTHVRADPAVFVAEIKAAGFEPLPIPNPPALKENVIFRFRKPAGASADPSGPVGE